MNTIKLKNGGVYILMPELWEKFTVQKSSDMLHGFEEWCSKNSDLMDLGTKIKADLTKKEWSRVLTERIKKEELYNSMCEEQG